MKHIVKYHFCLYGETISSVARAVYKACSFDSLVVNNYVIIFAYSKNSGYTSDVDAYSATEGVKP